MNECEASASGSKDSVEECKVLISKLLQVLLFIERPKVTSNLFLICRLYIYFFRYLLTGKKATPESEAAKDIGEMMKASVG